MFTDNSINEYLCGVLQDAMDGEYFQLFRLLRSIAEFILTVFLLLELFVVLSKRVSFWSLDSFLINHQAKESLRLVILWSLCMLLLIIHILEAISL